MVKADYKHDYYADLDLPATADQDTIKKRFRELGMCLEKKALLNSKANDPSETVPSRS